MGYPDVYTDPPPNPLEDPAEDTIAVADEANAEDDDEFEAEPFDAVSNASTSIKSSLLEHSFENGRRYHKYRNGRYPIPNDDVEQNRDDMKHAMMLELTDGQLFFAPIGDNPQKIIDLGTGTGIWAIDVADKFPSAEVLGVDLSPIQPTWVPPNCKFLVDDIEDEWMNGDNWDFVHMRCISPWLKDTSKLLKTAYQNLKPGAWIEIQEFDGRVNCDDGTIAPDAPLKRFYDLIPIAMAKFGTTFNAGENLREPLENAGFVNVNCKVLKVPFGPWPRNKTMRLIAHYCLLMMVDLMSAMAVKPFKKLETLNEVEIELLLAAAKKGIVDPKQHGYIKYFFWTAQKPE
ncbi:S-adenosyl-L-methionine-dependent methyltransferase [Thozetella sp. PMI_491]|nr:S-adenosyl-L-methionine-dependent methyltransferase [Thozetella sp. PMI_491]